MMISARDDTGLWGYAEYPVVGLASGLTSFSAISNSSAPLNYCIEVDSDGGASPIYGGRNVRPLTLVLHLPHRISSLGLTLGCNQEMHVMICRCHGPCLHDLLLCCSAPMSGPSQADRKGPFQAPALTVHALPCATAAIAVQPWHDQMPGAAVCAVPHCRTGCAVMCIASALLKGTSVGLYLVCYGALRACSAV